MGCQGSKPTGVPVDGVSADGVADVITPPVSTVTPELNLVRADSYHKACGNHVIAESPVIAPSDSEAVADGSNDNDNTNTTDDPEVSESMQHVPDGR